MLDVYSRCTPNSEALGSRLKLLIKLIDEMNVAQFLIKNAIVILIFSFALFSVLIILEIVMLRSERIGQQNKI